MTANALVSPLELSDLDTLTRVITGREYLRVSTVQTGRLERSTGDQHSDNLIAANERGVLLLEPIIDIGSASRHATKARDGFEDLLDMLRKDTFGANELWLWESSRGSRDTFEWAYLIKLCESRSVKIWVTSEHRLYDLSNDRDRIDLMEDAIDSEREVAKLRKRTKRGNRINAEAGLPHGRVPYGFERKYTESFPRRITGQVARPGEAEIVNELIDRLYVALVEKKPNKDTGKLDSLRSIELDFASRGIKSREVVRVRKDKDTGETWEETTGGIPFSAQNLRHLAMNEAYVGIRVYDTHRNQKGNNRPTVHAVRIEDAWPAIVDVDMFHAVREALMQPDRKTSKPGSGKWLLSTGHGALCDVCGGWLVVTDRDNRGKQYQCQDKGCVRVDMAELDALAETLILEYLTRRDVIADMAAKDKTNDVEVNKVRTDLAQLRTRETELTAKMEDALADGMDESDYVNARTKVRKRIKDTESRERERSTPSKLRGLDLTENVRAKWPMYPMSIKREVARMLLSKDGMIGELRVTPRCAQHRNSRCPVVDRIAWPVA